jgi:hypothetical protein
MLRRLIGDRSGATAMEFGLIGIFVFTLLFGIFDVGRYAIVLHSLQTLADESARQEIICYSPLIAQNKPLAGCSGNPLSAASKQAIAPFLYLGGATGGAPAVSTTVVGGRHVVQASQPGFTMLMPFFPASMNGPSVAVSLPF